MTGKRFVVENYSVRDKSVDTKYINSYYHIGDNGVAKRICDLLNELHEENEDWKHNCLMTVSENSILWNEISILMERGAEPSDAFKNYLNNLKNKNKKLQGN